MLPDYDTFFSAFCSLSKVSPYHIIRPEGSYRGYLHCACGAELSKAFIAALPQNGL